MAPTRLHIVFLIGLLLGLWPWPVNAAWTLQQLDNFFPQWNQLMHDLLDGTEGDERCCSYMPKDAAVGRGPYRTVECPLKGFYEFRKAEMAASSITLGLTPVLVSQLGPTHTQLALLGVRRPVLALILATDTASVSPLNSQSYLNLLVAEFARSFPSNAPKRGRMVPISLIEYTAALAALVNVGILVYQLCIWAVVSFTMSFKWLPAVYVLLAIPLYVSSLITVFGYFRILCGDPHCPLLPGTRGRAAADLLAWAVKAFIVLQSVIGILALSGLLFISVIDAVVVVLRFTVSTIVSKMIVSFELSGMREKTEININEQASAVEA